MNYPSEYTDLGDLVKEAKIYDLVLTKDTVQIIYLYYLTFPPLFLVLRGTRIVGRLCGLVMSF